MDPDLTIEVLLEDGLVHQYADGSVEQVDVESDPLVEDVSQPVPD